MLTSFQADVSVLEKAIQNAKLKSDQNAKVNALAKGLPTVTKGVIEAVKGFERNDPLAGSAALLDTAGAMVGIVAGISSAAGPPGALIGAVLSVFSMILKLFSAQPPAKSVGQQLDEVLRKYDAQKITDELSSIQDLLNRFVESVSSNDLTPLTYPEILETHGTVVGENLRLKILNAVKWMLRKENQELDAWDAVLASQCYAFIAYYQSMLIMLRIAKTEEDRHKLRDYVIYSFVHLQLDSINKLIEVARNRGIIWVSRYSDLAYRRHAVDSALGREYEWAANAPWLENGIINLTVTPRSTGFGNTYAGSDAPFFLQFSIENKYHRTFISYDTVTQEEYDEGKNYPYRDKVFEYNRLRGRMGQPPFQDRQSHGYGFEEIYDYRNQKKAITPLDVYAIPGFRDKTTFVYLATKQTVQMCEHGNPYWSKAIEPNLINRITLGYNAGYHCGEVRAVFPKPLATDDPALFALPDGQSPDPFDSSVSSLTGQINSNTHLTHIIYGACEVVSGKSVMHNLNATDRNRDHMEIHVHFFDMAVRDYQQSKGMRTLLAGGIMSPWRNFCGITTDDHYLWVYRAGAIACASHGAIKRCLEGKQEKPDWMVYQIPHSGISKGAYDPESLGVDIPADYYVYFRRGLLDLAAGGDGSLVAVFSGIRYGDDFVYLLSPVINPTASNPNQRLTMKASKRASNGWRTDRKVKANRAVKTPIAAYPLVQGLRDSLDKIIVK